MWAAVANAHRPRRHRRCASRCRDCPAPRRRSAARPAPARVGRRHRGQRRVVDRDQLRGIERLGVGLGDDQRDRLAGVAHLVRRPAAAAARRRRARRSATLASTVGPKRPSPSAAASAAVRTASTPGAAGRPRVDALDPGMRMRRAQHDGMRQPVEAQIVEIGAVAGDETRILAPLGRIADDGVVSCPERLHILGLSLLVPPVAAPAGSNRRAAWPRVPSGRRPSPCRTAANSFQRSSSPAMPAATASAPAAVWASP